MTLDKVENVNEREKVYIFIATVRIAANTKSSSVRPITEPSVSTAREHKSIYLFHIR